MKNNLVLLGIFLFGCLSIQPITGEQKLKLENPSSEIVTEVESMLDSVVLFNMTSEYQALKKGRKLTQFEKNFATGVGIKHPEDIRILKTVWFPVPQDPKLRKHYNQGRIRRFLSEGGRCSGFGIYIKPFLFDEKQIIRHELTHVAQVERLGLHEFLREYMIQRKTVGYFGAPLEYEAHKRSK